jgi:hypothetical protein
MRAPGSASVMTPVIMGVIVVVFNCVVLLGLVTGIIGIIRPRRKRGLAIAGFVLNLLVSLFVLGLIVVSKSALRS